MPAEKIGLIHTKGLSQIAWPVISLIITLFFLVDGKAILDPKVWAVFGPIIPIFLFIGIAAFLIGRDELAAGPPFYISMFWMAVFFAGGMIAFLPIAFAQGSFDVIGVLQKNYSFVLLQVFVVAANEELLFRSALVPRIGPLPAAILFAGFHLTVALGVGTLGLYTLVWPLTWGLIWGIIYLATRKRMGIGPEIGAHGAWNLSVALVTLR